jgi:hypothetical protein
MRARKGEASEIVRRRREIIRARAENFAGWPPAMAW